MSIEKPTNTLVNSQLFNTGFVDGKTPLNRDNLNPLIDGIKENDENLETVVADINTELENLDEALENTVGRKTSDGGEIFNDYEYNKALSQKSSASGHNTQAGGRAYGVEDNGYETKSTDTNGNIVESTYTLTTNEGLEELSSIINQLGVIPDVNIMNPDDMATIFSGGKQSEVFKIISVSGNFDTDDIQDYLEVYMSPLSNINIGIGLAIYNIPQQEKVILDNLKVGNYIKVDVIDVQSSDYNYSLMYNTPPYSLYFEQHPTETRSYGNFDYYGEIISVDVANSKITVTNGFKSNQLPNTEGNPLFIIPEYSHLGDKIIGSAANASGYDSKAINAIATVEGYNNLAAGKYSHAQNRDNIAGGYASDAGGWGNKALTKASFVRGKNNIIRKYGDYSAAFGEGHDIIWDHNFYVGKFGDNTSPRLFAVGMGFPYQLTNDMIVVSGKSYYMTSDYVEFKKLTDLELANITNPKEAKLYEVGLTRKNALEVTRGGMLMTFKSGDSKISNSVPQMWQLDLKAPLKSPTFTGTPKAPTQLQTDSSDNIATTKFVKDALNDTNYVTQTDLAPYIRGGRKIAQNETAGGGYKTYDGVFFYNFNGEKAGRGPQGDRSVINGDHCNTTEAAINSGAFGNWCSANFANSFAFGKGASTKAANQTVVGTYNADEDEADVNNPALFVVGNGTGSAWGQKSTAFNVRTDGSAEIKTMGTKDNSVVTKKYVDANVLQKDGWMDILRYIDRNVIDPEEGGIDELYVCKSTTNINGKSALEFEGTSAKIVLTQALPHNIGVVGMPFALVYSEDGVLSVCDIKVVNTIQLATRTEIAPIQHSMQHYIYDLGSFWYDEDAPDKALETGIYTIDSITANELTDYTEYQLHFKEGFTLSDKGSSYYDKLDYSVFTEGMRLNITFSKNPDDTTSPVDISIVLDVQDYINIRSMEARIAALEAQLNA